jgi:hypothetical protein
VICGLDLGVLTEQATDPSKPTEAPGTVTDKANESWWIPALFSVICGSSIAIAFALRKKQ